MTSFVAQDAHNLLRPETMESLFVIWRVTRDPLYREWGWLMFRAWQKFARVPSGGYTNLASVLEVPSRYNIDTVYSAGTTIKGNRSMES